MEDVDAGDIGKRSDAVLRTAMRGHGGFAQSHLRNSAALPNLSMDTRAKPAYDGAKEP
jgi:hypothetical protein